MGELKPPMATSMAFLAMQNKSSKSTPSRENARFLEALTLAGSSGMVGCLGVTAVSMALPIVRNISSRSIQLR